MGAGSLINLTLEHTCCLHTGPPNGHKWSRQGAAFCLFLPFLFRPPVSIAGTCYYSTCLSRGELCMKYLLTHSPGTDPGHSIANNRPTMPPNGGWMSTPHSRHSRGGLFVHSLLFLGAGLGSSSAVGLACLYDSRPGSRSHLNDSCGLCGSGS